MRQQGLVYGDRVLLVEEREGGAFLRSDGNVDKATYLQLRNSGSEVQSTIVDCAFEVSHRRTYRAHRALDEARESDLASEEKQRRMQKLRARVAEETEANEKETELIAGEPIVYGSTIQLRHVKSGGWLTLSADFKIVLDNTVRVDPHLPKDPATSAQGLHGLHRARNGRGSS
jgi:hypothetical protein